MAFANADAPAISTWIPTGSSATGVSYFGYYSSEVADMNQGGASIYLYNLIALNYKLNQRFTVSVRPTFTHDTAGVRYGYDMDAKTEMADSHIAVIDKNPITLPFDIKTKAVYKLFVPTQPDQVKANTIGGLGLDFEVARDLSNGFSVGYYPRGFILAQQQNTFLGKEGSNDKLKPTQSGRLEQWLRVTKYFGDKINLSQGVGVKDEYYNASTTDQQRHASFRLLETTLNFEVNNNFDFSVGVGQTNPSSRSLQVYNNSETAYLVMTSVRM
jgi:hypothetical protein